MVCFVWFMSSKVGCFGNIPLSSALFAQIKLVFWWLCLFLDLGSVMADSAGCGFVAEVREQSLYLDCFHLRREGDNHTHCQNCRIKPCLGVCSRDNTCEFCIFLQDEDWRAIDWARCANERTKESKSRSRERAQMDEDTVSLEPDDEDFFRPAVYREDQEGGSSGPFKLGEGDNHTRCQNCRINVCLGVYYRDNTCGFCMSLQEEDWRAIDWERCANERTKESKSRSRERAQMDEDTVSLESDDDDDFFRPAVYREDQEGGSSGPFRLGEGDNHTRCQNCRINVCLGVYYRDNTCGFCMSLQEEDWRAIDWARCANERTKESKSRSREREGPDGRGYSVSQARWWWGFFSTSSLPRRSGRRLVRTI